MMTRMIILSLVMMMLFLVGVLFGIEQASVGMVKLRGYSDQSLHEAVQTESAPNGKYEVKVMGRDFTQVSLDEKQVLYQNVTESHFTEKMAVVLEKSVKWFYNQVIFVIYQLIELVF